MKAVIFLKNIIRIGVIFVIVLLFFYITGDRMKENEPLESPVKHGTAVPVQDKGVGSAIPQTSRPENGLSTFVGKSIEALQEDMGEPTRIEPSAYGYEWWVYQENARFMAGVTKEGIINQIFTTDASINIEPFEIGQNLDEIYRFTIIGSEVDVQIEENIYTFSLTSDDLQTRMLVTYQDLYAQLYIDQEKGELAAVRFIQPSTLVLHQPYEMTYMGELLLPKPPSSVLQVEVNRTIERQIFELTNLYRQKYEVREVKSDYKLDVFAREHSEMLALESMYVEPPNASENLLNRLKDASIEHKKAGENIAFNYVDAIEAVHGWLNSPAHRKVLLDKDFTHMGVGAYGNYYSQSFIKFIGEDNRKR